MRTTLLLFLPVFAAGAQTHLTAPLLGFLWDETASVIRPMPGVPCAAAVGGAIDPGFTPRAVAISPRQDFALAVSSDDGQVQLVRLRGATPAASAVSGAISSPDRMLFSPAGRAALLYGQSAPQLQILSGLPADPATHNVDASTLPSSPSPLAVSDDGAVLLAANDGSAWLLPPDSPPAALGFSAAAAAFRRNSHDAMLLSPGGDVYLVQNSGAGSPIIRQVRAGDATAGAPAGIQFSRDGVFAYAAFATGIVLVIHLANGDAQPVACSCAPTTLEPLGDGDLFRVTGLTQPPVWLFDGPTMRFLFVPRAQQAADASPDTARSGQ